MAKYIALDSHDMSFHSDSCSREATEWPAVIAEGPSANATTPFFTAEAVRAELTLQGAQFVKVDVAFWDPVSRSLALNVAHNAAQFTMLGFVLA